MRYDDSVGQPLNVSGGDYVTVFGFDGLFLIKEVRPEGVAVVLNTAPNHPFNGSSVPLRLLTKVDPSTGGAA